MLKKIKRRNLIFGLIFSLFLIITPSLTKAAPSNNPIFATIEAVQQMIANAISPFQELLNSHEERIKNLENQNTSGKQILDYGQVRGSFWENTDSVNNVATPDQVSVNCSKACILWVNYDVDTRNTSAPFQHLYFIYVDGVDQAVFNQATMTVPNAAIPLAVNGVFPVAAGEHTVSIYARTYGGILQSFESHLQVLAIEQ